MDMDLDVDMDETSPPLGPPRRRPKVGHKKSRNGCKKCKARRVKCDEARPVCGNCMRLALDCAWPEPVAPPRDYGQRVGEGGGGRSVGTSHSSSNLSSHDTSPQGPGSVSSPAATDSGQTSTTASSGRQRLGHGQAVSPSHPLLGILRQPPHMRVDQTVFAHSTTEDPAEEEAQLPESRVRRLMEHRLMQNFIFNLSNPFPVAPSQGWRNLFGRDLPELGLSNDNLLYALMSLSATHLLRAEPDDLELFSARQRYLIAAMAHQRRMVDRLTVQTADAVCFGALIILINSFAMLQERALGEPYTPPLEWLQMGRGAGVIIWLSVQAVVEYGDVDQSLMVTIANAYPNFGEQTYFNPELRENYAGVLTQSLSSDDAWDDDTRDAYEKTLSYVGSIQKSIDDGEPVYVICRRIQAFALVLPPRFVDFLAQGRPRALVVLAHYFAMVAQVQGVWWLGEARQGVSITARREIEAIHQAVPEAWKAQMIWPVDMANAG